MLAPASRRIGICLPWCFAAGWLLISFAEAAAPSAAAIDIAPALEDAELHDVTFVDRWRGWAVGDRGAIWHTADGGSSWKPQPSGVNCRLTSVQFVSATQGWAAGGGALPPGDASRGELLSTRDGGRTWQPTRRLPLPAIRKLRFIDPQHGWCVGEPSALFPAGAATTSDGGVTWVAIPGEGSRGWLTADFRSPNDGVLAGGSGSLALVRRRGIEPGKTPGLGLRAIHSVRLSTKAAGWLVGDSGLVLTTTDDGSTWQVPGVEPPEFVSQFDWQAVATYGNHLWIAGSPGSRVLYSADQGKNWTLQATGQSLPLYGLCFADSKHGWAVGALGTILVTSDGGSTWRPQRAGGQRAAWLAVYSEPRELPLELWARLALGDGYLAAVQFVGRRDTTSDAVEEVLRADRARQALSDLGASSVSTAWRFPLPTQGVGLSAEQVLQEWNRASDGRAVEYLEEQLVRSVRTWRPDVVVTHAAYPRGDHPLEHLVNQAVLHAVEAAADEKRHPLHVTEMGLAPWQVKKVFGGPTPPTEDLVRVRGSEMVPHLSESLSQITELPRTILKEPLSSEGDVGFRLYLDRLPQKAGAKDFFAGIVLPSGGDARRRAVIADPQVAEARKQLAIRTRNLKAVLARSSREGQSGAELVGAMGSLVHDLDGPVAGRVLYQLAQDYTQSGEWALAAETMTLLTEQYPDHPLTPAALAWLVRYGASNEIRWRLNAGERLRAERIESSQPGGAVAQSLDSQQSVRPALNVQRADRIGIDHEREDPASERAIRAAKRLQELDPARASEPAIVLPLARAYRDRGLAHESDRLLMSIKQTRPRDAWWNCAAGEQWLARPEEACPKVRASCVRSTERPRLDGILDDAMWHQAERIDLSGGTKGSGDVPAAALFAYDAEFFYFAVSCRRAPKVDYPKADDSRPRDCDLSDRDHVDLYLDLDRDAASWFRLSVDYRGWTSDACCEDKRWDPQWYVAAETIDDVWTIEVAVPFEQMTRDFPRSKSVWSVGLQRVVPGVGFQSWTRPAAPAILPEGFGYLFFE